MHFFLYSKSYFSYFSLNFSFSFSLSFYIWISRMISFYFSFNCFSFVYHLNYSFYLLAFSTYCFKYSIISSFSCYLYCDYLDNCPYLSSSRSLAILNSCLSSWIFESCVLMIECRLRIWYCCYILLLFVISIIKISKDYQWLFFSSSLRIYFKFSIFSSYTLVSLCIYS